jgi:transposase
VNPRRWVVERFFAWIGRNRRLARDFEATIASAREAFRGADAGVGTEASLPVTVRGH